MEEKKPNTPRNSTVAVSPEIGKKLERFCASCGITKKDFISLSLDYFQRYGINPVKHESPAQEMQTLIKRVNQIVAFIRKQEQEALRPLCEATAVANTHIENVLSDLFFCRQKV
ncbi:BfmA/BtgA family mobilization protein [Bacteroides fragilis]